MSLHVQLNMRVFHTHPEFIGVWQTEEALLEWLNKIGWGFLNTTLGYEMYVCKKTESNHNQVKGKGVLNKVCQRGSV